MKPWKWMKSTICIKFRQKYISWILLESAANKPIVVIPDNINKWAGEDEDEDIKVSFIKFKKIFFQYYLLSIFYL